MPRKSRWVMRGGRVAPVILEKDVVEEIKKRLWFQGRVKVWQINCPVGGKVQPNEEGIPDLMGYFQSEQEHKIPVYSEMMMYRLKETIPLFIEVKRAKGAANRAGVATLAQEQFIAEARSQGCCAFFATCWNDVVIELGRFGLKLQGDS